MLKPDVWASGLNRGYREVFMSRDDDVTVYFATNRDIAGSDDEPRFGSRFTRKVRKSFG
jgi:hypothetical protein